jgi:hypothetical protein
MRRTDLDNADPAGTLFVLHGGTGRLFTMGQQSTVRDIGYYDATQKTNCAPIFRKAVFYVGPNKDGCTLENIRAANPYELCHLDDCNGFTATNVWGFPLRLGFRIGRVADVVRLNSVHFNPATQNWGSELVTDVLENGYAFLVDGPEEFNFDACFVFGYKYGVSFLDSDGDNFRGVYGSWRGGGLDQCGACVIVEANTGLTGRGFKMQGVSFIPSSGGYGIVMQDNHAADFLDQRPTIMVAGGSFSGTHDRCVWLFPSSTGVFMGSMLSAQGYAQDNTNGHQFGFAEGTGSIITVDRLMTPTGYARLAGGGTKVDTNGLVV